MIADVVAPLDALDVLYTLSQGIAMALLAHFGGMAVSVPLRAFKTVAAPEGDT